MVYLLRKTSFTPVHGVYECASSSPPVRISEAAVLLGETIDASSWAGGAAISIFDDEQPSGFRGSSGLARDALVLRFPLGCSGVHPSSQGAGPQFGYDSRSDEILLLDLSTNPPLLRTRSSRCLYIGFDRSFLEDVADRAGGHHCGVMDLLRGACGQSISDAVVRELCASLAMLAGQAACQPTFTSDQILVALAAHLVFKYGELASVTATARGGLAPWQVRRSQAKMRARLYEPLNLDEIASDCGLSISHFSRAFRCSVGMPPHAWRVRQRVEHAKGLMKDRTKTLAEVAIECGFADQSHFTRVFSREMGASPGNWRRNACDMPAQPARSGSRSFSLGSGTGQTFDCHI